MCASHGEVSAESGNECDDPAASDVDSVVVM